MSESPLEPSPSAAPWEAWLDRSLAWAASERPRRWAWDAGDTAAWQATQRAARPVLRRCLGLANVPPPGSEPPAWERLSTWGPAEIWELRWQPWPEMTASALVAALPAAAGPIVLVCHELDGSPEATLRWPLLPSLVEAGLTVVVPRLPQGWYSRMRLARKARLLGLEWLGLELLALSRLLDVAAQTPLRERRWGVLGFSRGGQTAMHLAALDGRIGAAAVASWFCDRDRRLCDTTDGRLAAFLDSPEDEQFLSGWSTRFSDLELAYLVCPRPLLITGGLDDPVIPYEDVERVYAPVEKAYRRLGFEGEAALHLVPGGHEPGGEATVAWLVEQLSKRVEQPEVSIEPAFDELLPEVPLLVLREGPARPHLSRCAQARRQRARATRRPRTTN